MKGKKDDRTLSLLLAKFFACPPCKWNNTLQNSRFFLKIGKETGKESYAREARQPHTPVGRLWRDWGETLKRVSLASLPSLTRHFQPRSRPFVGLLAL